MKTPNKERELVLLTKTATMSEKALEKELISLEELLQFSESPVVFCMTHELARRNGLTHKTEVLLQVYYQKELKPFQFLICIN